MPISTSGQPRLRAQHRSCLGVVRRRQASPDLHDGTSTSPSGSSTAFHWQSQTRHSDISLDYTRMVLCSSNFLRNVSYRHLLSNWNNWFAYCLFTITTLPLSAAGGVLQHNTCNYGRDSSSLLDCPTAGLRFRFRRTKWQVGRSASVKMRKSLTISTLTDAGFTERLQRWWMNAATEMYRHKDEHGPVCVCVCVPCLSIVDQRHAIAVLDSYCNF